MSSFRRSRILFGVRLFLFSALVSGALGADPVTTEGRINRNAFPLAAFPSKYTMTPKGVERELRSRMNQVLTPIRLAPASWFRASFGTVPSSPDRRKIFESLNETEIFTCLGKNCDGCGGLDSLGCVIAKINPSAVGVVALIHPCLYGEGKCPRGSPPDVATWTERVVTTVAYYKSGLKKDTQSMQKANKASSAWLANTSRSVNLMLGACPGPYAAESLKFLFNLESVTLPNPAILRCGQTYLEVLRGLPKTCKALVGPLKTEWLVFEKKQLRASADILRCDSYCLKMLCRQRDAGTVFTRFSDKPALLIGDGACEGETPKVRGVFLREALPRLLRAKLEETGCFPPLEKVNSGTTLDDATSTLGDGPSVDLVE